MIFQVVLTFWLAIQADLINCRGEYSSTLSTEADSNDNLHINHQK